jgi:hypothetical protein
MRIALEDLKLHSVAVIYPGDRRYPLADRVEAVPLAELAHPKIGARSLFRKR